jgi:hypothetical protein
MEQRVGPKKQVVDNELNVSKVWVWSPASMWGRLVPASPDLLRARPCCGTSVPFVLKWS